MPIPLVNSIASWFLKKRIHQMELFIKYPIEVQTELLRKLISKAKNTEMGRTYEFNSIRTYTDFAERVPIQNYEDYQEKIERSRRGENDIVWPTPIRWLAKPRGATDAKSKYIPGCEDALEDCDDAAGKGILCMYLSNNPSPQMYTGNSLRLGGSKDI